VDGFFVHGQPGDRTQHRFGLGMSALRGYGAPEQEPSAAGFEIAGNRSTEMPNLSCSEVNHRGHDLRYYVPCPIE
jgi:hypothetical protein